MAKQVIAIDLDGVLAEFRLGWGDGSIGEPICHAKWAVKTLIKNGFEVVILTTREDKTKVLKWLYRWDFPIVEITNKKPRALAYIDDRGIRFQGHWESIVKLFC